MDKNKSQSYSDVQEARRAEARERSRIRSLGEAFGKAALGGQTLSEALRSPLAQTSTRERRRIKIFMVIDIKKQEDINVTMKLKEDV